MACTDQGPGCAAGAAGVRCHCTVWDVAASGVVTGAGMEGVFLSRWRVTVAPQRRWPAGHKSRHMVGSGVGIKTGFCVINKGLLSPKGDKLRHFYESYFGLLPADAVLLPADQNTPAGRAPTHAIVQRYGAISGAQRVARCGLFCRKHPALAQQQVGWGVLVGQHPHAGCAGLRCKTRQQIAR